MARAITDYQLDPLVVPGADEGLFHHLLTLKEAALTKYQQWLDRKGLS